MLQRPDTIQWVIDGHAHFYPTMDSDLALDSAQANFSRICRQAGLPVDTPKVLAVADPSWQPSANSFDLLRSSRRPNRWTVTPCADDLSLRVRRETDGAVLFIVLGQQIRASCGLEVLALATRQTFDDGMSFPEVVAQVLQRVGFAILPWGLGKWYGNRGRKAVAVLQDAPQTRVFVGDNSGRAVPLPTPNLITLCRERGIPILPGSDPLPISGQERKLGRYGFMLTGGFDPDAPGYALNRSLLQLSVQPRILGTREGLVPFLLSQGLLLTPTITSNLRRQTPGNRLDE